MKKNRNLRQIAAIMLAVSGLFMSSFAIQRVTAQNCVADPSTGNLSKACDPNPPSNPVLSNPDPIAAINTEIETKQKQIEELKLKSEAYERQINSTRGEIRSLQTEVAAVDNQIALTNIDLETKAAQIESLDLEIRSLQLSIDAKSAEVATKKTFLADNVRQLDASARTTTLALVMQSGSFSDFFGQAQAQAEISNSLQTTIGEIQRTRQELQSKQDELNLVKDDVKQQQLLLEDQKSGSLEQQTYKNQLLSTTKRTARQYEQLLSDSRSENDEVNAAIGQLQASLQARLNAGGIPVIDLPSPSGFIWPVPGRQINAYFMDPNYNVGGRTKHYGIDIDAEQGTPVKATADGVVVGIRPPTLNGSPSVVQIQHGGGFVSYFLHMHKIFVAEGQQIKQGDLIGYSGGACGTTGAGTCLVFTTGAHLHYEMHLDNIAVDPLKYLP
ncbi:MAG: peptidoglycan DD-metalloendopeptidase family protein [Patescibacteria group bacterium]